MMKKKKNNYREVLPAACFPMNARVELTAAQIGESPCASGLLFNNTVNFTVDTSRVEPTRRFVFSGQSNSKQCAAEVDMLMPRSKCDYAGGQCSFFSVYQPPIDDVQFLVSALSLFFFTILVLNFELFLSLLKIKIRIWTYTKTYIKLDFNDCDRLFSHFLIILG